MTPAKPAQLSWDRTTPCIAFEGWRAIAAGPLAEVAVKVKTVIDRGPRGPVLVFDDSTSEQIEIDFTGTPQQVASRLPEKPAETTEGAAPAAIRGRGRPKLGVIAREVTLLPRHWDWLTQQPGGASVALRKLVEEARRTSAPRDQLRVAQESAYRFLSAIAGNLPNYEETLRALFAGKSKPFTALIKAWPDDIQKHAIRLARRSFGPQLGVAPQ